MSTQLNNILKFLAIIVIIVMICYAYDSYIRPRIESKSLDQNKLEKERLQKEAAEYKVLYDEAISKMLPDTVYINHEILTQNEKQGFNDRIIRVVSLSIDSSVLQLQATISKGDSIRNGHLDLVNAR